VFGVGEMDRGQWSRLKKREYRKERREKREEKGYKS
jgi:hypothetical protein